jgi:hypothetical protein
LSLNNQSKNTKYIDQSTAWTKRFDFFAVATWLMLSVWLAGISLILYGMDFRGYYAAAQTLIAGGNPYDYHQVAPLLLKITGEMGNNPYYYPPWFAWFFIPLTVLPFQMARVVWLTFNLIIWNLGLWNLREIFHWPIKGWRLYLLYSLATFSFAWITWRYEQAGVLIFVILIAMIKSIQNQQWTWAGFWMALSLIKPNITLLVIIGLSVWLIRQRQWRPVLTAFVWLAILLAISTWITPNWYQPVFEKGFGQGLTVALDGPDKVVALRINTTMMDWLATLGVGNQLRSPIYGIASAVGVILLFLTAWHSQSLLQVISLSLLISFAITPYAMQYDNPALIIVVFWALYLCSLSANGIRVGILLAGFVFSVIFWQQNISWAYWMIVGSIALVVWAMVVAKRSSESKVEKSI